MAKPAQPSQPLTGESLVSRAIREALEAIASPEVSQRILERALHMARRPAIPAGGEDFRTFVHQHLRKAVDFALGDETADAFVGDLQPILRMADDLDDVSRVRATGEESAAAARPARKRFPSLPELNLRNPKVPKAPPPGISAPVLGAPPSTAPPEDDSYWIEDELVTSDGPGIPTVLIATLDLDRTHRLGSHLTGEASVQLVGDIVELLEALQGAPRQVVVIDCMNPSIQAATIATVAPDLPEGSTVVLWGASEALYRQLESLGDHTRRWLRCGTDATTEDVASLVAMLVG